MATKRKNRKPLKQVDKDLTAEGFKSADSGSTKVWDSQQFQRRLLEQIALGARHCQEIEREFGKSPPPELETLIKLHRVIILQLSTQTDSSPGAARLVTAMMKPVMEWARLQEHRKARELAESKYRDLAALQKAAIERELNGTKTAGGLSPETLEKIERELKLM